MIELECLAAAWAMQKAGQFLKGLPALTLVTDHKPLFPILNDQSLDKLDNPRILRLRLKMQRFDLVATLGPGKNEHRRGCAVAGACGQAEARERAGRRVTSNAAHAAVVVAIAGSTATVAYPVLAKIEEASQGDATMTACARPS